MATDMTQAEFNAMLQIALAQGFPGGIYMSKFGRGEDIDAALDGGVRAGAVSVPSRSLNLASSELQARIDALPRLLTEHLYLNVTGTLDTMVKLTGFYGSGDITFFSGGNNFTLRHQLLIEYCSIPINIQSINFQERVGVLTANAGLISVEKSAFVYVYNCGFTGLGKDSSAASAVSASYGSNVRFRAARVSGCKNAVMASMSSILSVEKDTAADFLDNEFGAFIWNGGIVLLGSNVPAMLGGLTHKKLGGMIVGDNGAPL